MVSTHLKNSSQNGNLPQLGVKKKYLKPPPSYQRSCRTQRRFILPYNAIRTLSSKTHLLKPLEENNICNFCCGDLPMIPMILLILVNFNTFQTNTLMIPNALALTVDFAPTYHHNIIIKMRSSNQRIGILRWSKQLQTCKHNREYSTNFNYVYCIYTVFMFI